jgi:hypothetical protein
MRLEIFLRNPRVLLEVHSVEHYPKDVGNRNGWKETGLFNAGPKQYKGASSSQMSILESFKVQRAFIREKRRSTETQQAGSPCARQGLGHSKVCLLSSSLQETHKTLCSPVTS